MQEKTNINLPGTEKKHLELKKTFDRLIKNNGKNINKAHDGPVIRKSI